MVKGIAAFGVRKEPQSPPNLFPFYRMGKENGELELHQWVLLTVQDICDWDYVIIATDAKAEQYRFARVVSQSQVPVRRLDE